MEPTFLLDAPPLPGLSIPLIVLVIALIGLVIGLGSLVVGVSTARLAVVVAGTAMVLLSGGLSIAYATGNSPQPDPARTIQTDAWPAELAPENVVTDLSHHYADIRSGAPVTIERANGLPPCTLRSSGVDDNDAVALTLSCRPNALIAPKRSR